MFMIKRNQVIVTALVVMIGVAGYLNFTDSKTAQSSKSAIILTDEGDAQMALIPSEDTPLADNGPDENLDIAQGSVDPITVEALGEQQGTEKVAQAEKSDTGEAIFVNQNLDGKEYFVQAKLTREQARAKEKDILTEMINNDNVDKDKKSDCADSMLELQKRIEKESAAEAMIESKGFAHSYVRIDDSTVDVVVSKEQLTEAETAQILDIVQRKTGVKQENIRISPLKK